MRLYLVLLFLSFSVAGCGQEPGWNYIPLVDTVAVPLGNSEVIILKHRYSPHITTPLFVHLHHNEQTADSALHNHLAVNGGQAIGISNIRQRLIAFSLGQKPYLFDPNRMFTPAGIEQSLKLLSSTRPQAAQAISQLSTSLLQLLTHDEPVIAMHNNTDGAYSILSYMSGGIYAAEAKGVFQNPEMDSDNFVLTTDPGLFAYLEAEAINTVLQDNEKVTDDGSLGYFLGKQDRLYVNIEAEHGHLAVQTRMVEAVTTWLKSKIQSDLQITY